MPASFASGANVGAIDNTGTEKNGTTAHTVGTGSCNQPTRLLKSYSALVKFNKKPTVFFLPHKTAIDYISVSTKFPFNTLVLVEG